MAPLPIRKLISPFCLTFAESFNEFALFSYVGFMVLDLEPTLKGDTTKLGFYSGVLGSAFFIGTFFSSFVWGRISDIFGRKPVLLIGTFSALCTTIAYGFSPSFVFAICVRLINGLLDGTLGVVKTTIADVTDSTNQSAAFTVWCFLEAIANMAGAVVGGYLSRPAVQYPNAFSADGIWAKFPYLLVNVVASCFYIISLFMIFYFHNESNRKVLNSYQKINNNKNNAINDNMDDNDDKNNTMQLELETEDESQSLTFKEKCTFLIGSFTNNNNNSKLFSFMKDSPALFASVSYAVVGFQHIIWDEIFPTWSIARISDGGLEFNPSDLGIVFSVSGVAMLCVQALVYIMLIKIGLLATFRLGSICTIALFPFIPTLNFIAQDNSRASFWALLLILSSLRICIANLQFSPINQMIQNSVLPENAGTVSGFAQSLVAFCRATGPFTGGYLLAWSFKNSLKFPFNFFFPFLLLSFIGIVCLVLAVKLPDTLNKPKKELKNEGKQQ